MVDHCQKLRRRAVLKRPKVTESLVGVCDLRPKNNVLVGTSVIQSKEPDVS